jgi:hypothetical protein
VFIGVHLPAYLKDQGIGNPSVAVLALALIGLFNIFGSYYAGKLVAASRNATCCRRFTSRAPW